MDVIKLLDKIDGTQQLKIIDYNNRKTLYEGEKLSAHYVNKDIVSIYTNENKLIIEVV